AQLLGGQLLLRGDYPLPPQFAQEARARGLREAHVALFASMALGSGAQARSQLVAVKAVGPGYPLLGHVALHAVAPGVPLPDTPIPAPGTVWVAANLAQRLGVPPQGPLTLGERSLRIAAVITGEPDRGVGIPGLAPRVLLNAADLASTGLIQPASRVNYSLALDGSADAVRAYAAWARREIRGQGLRGVELSTPDGNGNGFDRNLRRGADYLRLVALLAALLAGVAVGVAAQDFARRRRSLVALLKALGMSRRQVLLLLGAELAVLGLSAALLGSLLGLGLQAALLALLRHLVDTTQLGAPGWQPPALALLCLGAVLLAFALPTLLRLSGVPPLRVLRREAVGPSGASSLVGAIGLLLFLGVLGLIAGDARLGGIAVGGFAAAAALLGLLSWGLLALLRRARGRGVLALAARQLGSRGLPALLQISALGLAVLALALVGMLRSGLLAGWQASLPADAPNRFVINIQPDQGEAFRAALASAGLRRFDWYPMVRARLVAVDGRPVFGRDYAEPRARQLVDREFNLSATPRLPADNRVVAGSWQGTAGAGAGGLSVDQGIAETLGLKLGDRLRFDIAGQRVEGRITSLRKVDWASMRVNFFVLFPRAEMDGLPVSYISAFRAPPQPGFDNQLARDFPNITSIDVSATIAQLQRVLDQVIQAVQFLFGFTLAAGLVVLFAAVSATRESRSREFAIMRALGAGSRLLAQVQRAELLGVGALAGLLAGTAAVALGWALARYVFGFEWQPSPWVPLAGSAAGAALALAAGWWGLREVLRRPVLQSLRSAA
ncbi:MAG: FtsX-like permease family protein, partial [Burkholderiales bacterium]|nr:FtsX-like permease family protein [Burkholderiales bacterium]